MIRISLSSLALAAVLVAGAATPAASETLRNTDPPTSCGCSDCSGEQCQSKPPANYLLVIETLPSTPGGTGFTTQPGAAVDPSGPHVVYVGGRRY